MTHFANCAILFALHILGQANVANVCLVYRLSPLLSSLPEAQQDLVLAQLSENGFFGVVGKSHPFVDAAINISLLASDQQLLESIRMQLMDEDVAADDDLARLTALSDQFTVALFAISKRAGGEELLMGI